MKETLISETPYFAAEWREITWTKQRNSKRLDIFIKQPTWFCSQFLNEYKYRRRSPFTLRPKASGKLITRHNFVSSFLLDSFECTVGIIPFYSEPEAGMCRRKTRNISAPVDFKTELLISTIGTRRFCVFSFRPLEVMSSLEWFIKSIRRSFPRFTNGNHEHINVESTLPNQKSTTLLGINNKLDQCYYLLN